jgi:hypothetical protein
VDDGSTDGTGDAVREYLHDSRIRYIFQPHAGQAAARNRALAEAQGELIAYLDGDDSWFPGHLQAAVNASIQHPQRGMSYAAAMCRDQHNGLVHIEPGSFEVEHWRNGEAGFRTSVLVHRRHLTDRFGGFDERMRRLSECDLILRYSSDSEPIGLPLLGAACSIGSSQQVSRRESYHRNAYILRRKHDQAGPLPIRVLYVLWQDPALCESSVRSEIAAMRRWGVEIEAWSEMRQCTLPLSEGLARAESLAGAIKRFRPHTVHFTHWLNLACRYSGLVARTGRPLTVRGHKSALSPDSIASLQHDDAVAGIYLLPEVAATYSGYDKVHSMGPCFDADLYYPSVAKDRDMVIRTGVALPYTEYRSFFQVARACRRHRFVLAVTTCPVHERFAEELEAHNRSLGSPVELFVDLPAEEEASLVRQAAIYLHTFCPGGFTEMPVAIVEALAAGCWVLAGHSPATQTIIGDAGCFCATPEDAAVRINETTRWSSTRWQVTQLTAVDHAYSRFADTDVLRPLLETWKRLANERSHAAAA